MVGVHRVRPARVCVAQSLASHVRHDLFTLTLGQLINWVDTARGFAQRIASLS